MSARTDVARRVWLCATTGLLNSSDKVCPKTCRTGLSDELVYAVRGAEKWRPAPAGSRWRHVHRAPGRGSNLRATPAVRGATRMSSAGRDLMSQRSRVSSSNGLAVLHPRTNQPPQHDRPQTISPTRLADIPSTPQRWRISSNGWTTTTTSFRPSKRQFH
jgi:hypothetical protein